MTRCGAAVLAMIAVIAGSTLTPQARADTPPSQWDVARDPSTRDAWSLHVRVQRLLSSDEPGREEQLRLEAARAMLEDAGSERRSDVRLRFDLGIVYERLELPQRAADVLAPALSDAPDGPASTRAFQALAYAYAKLNRPVDELAAWRHYLPRLEDDFARAPELMNMGEAEMRLGHIDDALQTFREVIRLCLDLPNTDSVISTHVLSLWDLAIALDRSGDPRGALDNAARAKAFTWHKIASSGAIPSIRVVTGSSVIKDTDGVFFVPAWERDWYLALGAVADAMAAKDPRDEATYWGLAEDSWARYVAGSSHSTSDDPWLPIARLRLEQARVRHRSAESRASKLPPRTAE